MSIFNSLGSNYSGKFVWRNLLAFSSKTASNNLQQVLKEHYTGNVILTYKGREALELALRHSNLPPGSLVGINGFTCYVLYQAVVNAGYQALFIDITPGQTNFDIIQLKHAKIKNPGLSAIIVQNTLGYPADMVELDKFCKAQSILLIEDLAHSVGAIYSDGREVGTVGALIMLSFSQDKPVDVVAGGALIDRRSNTSNNLTKLPLVSAWQRLKNRFYPFWTGLIRTTYQLGIGRVLHFSLKRFHLLSTPMSEGLEGLHSMSSSTAGLILQRWQDRQSELDHRREIAAIYTKNIISELQLIQPNNGQPTYLRFPIRLDDPKPLIDYLRTQHIFIGDTWYDAPIGPKNYLAKTNYQAGSCPSAEDLAKHIVNLPTHRHITPVIAADICAKIKQWQTLQQKS